MSVITKQIELTPRDPELGRWLAESPELSIYGGP